MDSSLTCSSCKTVNALVSKINIVRLQDIASCLSGRWSRSSQGLVDISPASGRQPHIQRQFARMLARSTELPEVHSGQTRNTPAPISQWHRATDFRSVALADWIWWNKVQQDSVGTGNTRCPLRPQGSNHWPHTTRGLQPPTGARASLTIPSDGLGDPRPVNLSGN